jgi:hypothetical protein
LIGENCLGNDVIKTAFSCPSEGFLGFGTSKKIVKLAGFSPLIRGVQRRNFEKNLKESSMKFASFSRSWEKMSQGIAGRRRGYCGHLFRGLWARLEVDHVIQII